MARIAAIGVMAPVILYVGNVMAGAQYSVITVIQRVWSQMMSEMK